MIIKRKFKQQWMAVHGAGYAKLPEQFSVGVRVVSVSCVFVPFLRCSVIMYQDVSFMNVHPNVGSLRLFNNLQM